MLVRPRPQRSSRPVHTQAIWRAPPAARSCWGVCLAQAQPALLLAAQAVGRVTSGICELLEQLQRVVGPPQVSSRSSRCTLAQALCARAYVCARHPQMEGGLAALGGTLGAPGLTGTGGRACAKACFVPCHSSSCSWACGHELRVLLHITAQMMLQVLGVRGARGRV